MLGWQQAVEQGLQRVVPAGGRDRCQSELLGQGWLWDACLAV